MTKTLRIFASLTLILMLTACGAAKRYTPFNKATASTQTGSFKIGNPYKIMGKWYTPKETYNFTQNGIASWYGPDFDGKLTANGETYDQYALTAAHNTLQMPSIVRVTNLENGRSIIVRINDRGPFARGRVIDMSKRGAELLQFKNQGTAKVKIQVLEKESRAIAAAAKRGQRVDGVEIALNKGQSIEEILGMEENDQYTSAQPISLNKAPPGIPTAKIPAIEVQALAPPSAIQPTLAQEQAFIKQVPVPSSPIFVQAGAFKSISNANAFATRLQKFGPAKVHAATINNQTFYRVKIGPVPSIKNADIILSDMVASGHNSAIIVVD